jgi:hypothetical protein
MLCRRPESDYCELVCRKPMCSYWLYILKHDLHSRGCTLAISASPHERDLDSGKLQTANYRSWKQLSEALIQAGIDPAIVRNIEAPLESEGLETLRDLLLSDEQVRTLGFRRLADSSIRGAVSPGA